MTWADTDYKYKKKITIDHTLVDGDETNFPVLVSVTDADLADTSNGGYVESANGYDIIFYDSAESTLLEHEIEKYTNTNGTLIYWVRINSLDNGADTEFYIYFGRAGVAVDPSSTDTWDSNFMAVWHMANLTDSTSNGIDLTNHGADATPAGGKIGDCYRFIEANNDFMYHDTFLDTIPASDELTLEGWAYFESDTSVDQHMISKTNIASEDRFGFRRSTGDDFLEFWMEANNGGNDFATDDDAIADDTWVHCVGTYGDSVALRTIRNGADITIGDVTPQLRDGTAFPFCIGCYAFDYGVDDYRFEMDGYLDEIRISDIIRSNNWISTSYETMNDPVNFMGFGGLQVRPIPLDALTVTGVSYTVVLKLPLMSGESNKITKDIDRKSFWSGNYVVTDDGIASQPLVLTGIEFADPLCGIAFESACFPLYFNMGLTNKMKFIIEMADNNEEVAISGLGDCMDGVYIIQNFRYNTVKGAINVYAWNMTLEKVR